MSPPAGYEQALGEYDNFGVVATRTHYSSHDLAATPYDWHTLGARHVVPEASDRTVGAYCWARIALVGLLDTHRELTGRHVCGDRRLVVAHPECVIARRTPFSKCLWVVCVSCGLRDSRSGDLYLRGIDRVIVAAGRQQGDTCVDNNEHGRRELDSVQHCSSSSWEA